MSVERLQRQVINRLPPQFRQWGKLRKEMVELYTSVPFDWKWLGWMNHEISVNHIIALTLYSVDLASMIDI